MFCRNCRKKLFKKIITVNSQPISSIFYKKKKENLKKYSLNLFQCSHCKLVQLLNSIPTEKMYGTTYGYQTSLSNLMINHLKIKFKNIIKKKILNKYSNILDIGSNDGTFLNFFADLKINGLFGIDPSGKKFRKFYNKKIKLIPDFFTKNNFDKNVKKKNNIKFSLITSFAMFYDIDDPNSFCSDIYKMLDVNGIWILELSYFPLLLKNLTYDQICHEHVAYYTLSTFNNIIKKNKLKIIDCSLNKINGGSIEIVCSRIDSKFKIKKSKINKIFYKESLINDNSYKIFNHKLLSHKYKIKSFFKNNTDKNNIIGYGAATKGNIILNYCGLNKKNINFIADANSYKIGRYTPGSNIKIISKKKINSLSPNYLFVLIWSFKSEVIRQEIKFLKNGGKLIFPLPYFHIITKKNYYKHI